MKYVIYNVSILWEKKVQFHLKLIVCFVVTTTSSKTLGPMVKCSETRLYPLKKKHKRMLLKH